MSRGPLGARHLTPLRERHPLGGVHGGAGGRWAWAPAPSARGVSAHRSAWPRRAGSALVRSRPAPSTATRADAQGCVAPPLPAVSAAGLWTVTGLPSVCLPALRKQPTRVLPVSPWGPPTASSSPCFQIMKGHPTSSRVQRATTTSRKILPPENPLLPHWEFPVLTGPGPPCPAPGGRPRPQPW